MSLVDYLGYSVEVMRVGIQNRLVYGTGVLEYSSFSGFYSDYLSKFRFYKVLGILKCMDFEVARGRNSS